MACSNEVSTFCPLQCSDNSLVVNCNNSFVFAAAAGSDPSPVVNCETALTDCQAAVNNLCLDNDDGMSSAFN